MQHWRSRVWFRAVSAVLISSIACSPGGRAGDGSAVNGGGKASTWRIAGNAPASASVTATDEAQAGFPTPVNNYGAFVHTIPIAVPPGIGGLTPELALSYSSQNGIGAAGAGWDLALPAIMLNTADGVRPGEVAADVERYAPGTAVERYTSNFGTLAVIRDQQAWADSVPTYVISPFNDQVVRPIADEHARTNVGADEAAWVIKTKDGTTYRYGYRDYASLVKNAGVAGQERKVAWYLDRVEDRNGNVMRYYYEEYPNRQYRYRQPILRAIEYGIPARAPQQRQRIVVMFDYVEATNWYQSSFNLGTRIDSRFMLDRVCTFANTQVFPGTIGDRIYWDVGDAAGVEQTIPGPCTELTYNFEDLDHDGSADYAASFTSRPLLMKVQTVAPDGSKLPPWEMTYEQQGRDWTSVYRDSLAAGGKPVAVPDDASLQRATRGIEQMALDVNADGALDFVSGTTSGDFDVQLGTYEDSDADGQLDAYAPGAWLAWPNPLRDNAEPASLTATMNNPFRETRDSDCWYGTDFHVDWSAAGGGLAYARPLTAAPPDFDSIYDDATDEAENQHVDLGGFQFLQSSFNGAMPAVGDESALNSAETFDELEKFGSYKSNAEEVAFDFRASDCKDHGDEWEIDQCFATDGASSTGSLGALECLDAAGPRFLTTAIDPDSAKTRGYSSTLWDWRDMDGDGLVDLVFAANVMQRDEDGMRNFASGDNDWYWSRNNGNGFDAPARWVMPSKLGSTLGLSEVDRVHATGFLSTQVTSAPIPPRAPWGAWVSAGLGGPHGVHFGGGLILGGYSVGLPTGAMLRGDIGAIGMSLGSQAARYGIGYAANAAGASQLVGAASTLGGLAIAGSRGGLGMATESVLPSIKLSLTTNGPSLWLPIAGDLLQYAIQHEETRQHWLQGMADLDGDGRPDYVSAKWDAGSTTNGNGEWLFYRNARDGFETPELWRFASPPATPHTSTPEAAPPSAGAISAMQSVNFTKQIFEPSLGNPKRGYGMIRETYGLVDMNGDGLADYVDGNPYTIDGEMGWFVHFNEGDRFGAPEFWPFDGDWQTAHGEPGCTMVLTAPRISESVYGQPDLAFPTATAPGFGYSRQVQGLADIDRDGDPDYWYEEPYRTDESDAAVCSYTHLWSEEDDFLESVAPRELRRRLLVRRNDGTGFGAPEEWVPDTGYSLNGGSTMSVHQGNNDPASVETTVEVATADYDADGALDVAVHLSEGWQSFALTASNPDVLSTITAPTGGVLAASYRPYFELGGQMGTPIWVVEAVTATDPVGASQTVVRTFEYEHGVLDREERRFLGFERVYEHSASGYTLSRYYQQKGYEGQLYCREVRSTASAQGLVRSAIAAHESSWAAGASPVGHHVAVAVGAPIAGTARPTSASGLDSTSPPAGAESSGGAIADTIGAYGPAPAPTADEPDNETDEAATDVAEVDEWPAPGHRPPPRQSFGLNDTDYWIPDIPFIDTAIQGDEETPETNSAPPGDFWDLDFYGDCSTTGVTIGDITYYCEPDEITDDMLACGDTDDPGTIAEAQFYVLGEHGIDGVPAPRLAITSDKLYNAAGTALVTRTELTYDDLGNLAEVKDLGGTAVAGDELTTTTAYAALDETRYRTGFPCHQTVTDGSGAVVRETWQGYDGGAAGACSAVGNGNVTALRRAVNASETVEETFAYNDEGYVTNHTDARGTATLFAYDPVHPWLKVSEGTLVVAYDGPKLLTKLWTYYGNGVSPDENFGRLYREVGYDGALTEYAYDAFGRPTTTLLPEDSPGQPSESIIYTDWNGDVPLRPALVEHRKMRAGGGYASATTRLDGWGREARTDSTAPNNSTCSRFGFPCDVVSAERTFDDNGRVIDAVLPYFDRPTIGTRPSVQTTYDLLGRVTQVIGANGAITKHAYDREYTTTQDSDGVVTVLEADARGKTRYQHAYIDAGATLYATTETEHDALGQLRRIIDPGGNEWLFERDWLGRTTSEHDPNTGTVNRAYDANGNLRVLTDDRYAGSGLVTEFLYDPLNRPMARTVYVSATVSGLAVTGGRITEMSVWAYDVNPGLLPDATITTCSDGWRGRLSRVDTYRYLTGAQVLVNRKDYCYDDRGRVLNEHDTVDGVLYPFAYTYNPDDTVASATYPDGDVLTYEYDAAGFLNRLTSAHVGTIVDDAELDASGQLKKRTLGAGTLVQQNCYGVGEGTYRLARAMTATPATLQRCDQPATAGSALYDATYEYPAGGSDRIASRKLAYLDPSAGWVERESIYAYDGRSRLANESYDDGTGAVATAYANDELGNLITKGSAAQSYGDASRSVRGAGPNALVETSSGMELTYGPTGNVTRIEQGADTYRIVYDARNQLLAVEKNGTITGEYWYDEAGRRVRKDSGGVTTSYVGPMRFSSTRTETVYPGIGVKVTVGGVETLHFTISDPASSTALTIDGSGAVTQAIEYEPYGKPRHESIAPGGYDSDFLFNSKEQEAAFDTLSIDDFGPRLYFADVGRWMTPDASLVDGPDRYAFVRGDPINNADPSGHATVAMLDGIDAHQAISAHYAQYHPQADIDISLAKIAADHGVPVGPLGNALRRRPDIYDRATGDVFEIKPMKAEQIVIGGGQAALYVAKLKLAGLSAQLGTWNAPQTWGIANGNRGFYLYFMPVPAVITYLKVPESEYAALVLELAKNPGWQTVANWLAYNPDSAVELAIVGGTVAAISLATPDELVTVPAGALLGGGAAAEAAGVPILETLVGAAAVAP